MSDVIDPREWNHRPEPTPEECDYEKTGEPCWGDVEDVYPDDDDGCTTHACEGHRPITWGDPYLREEDKVPEPPRPPEQYVGWSCARPATAENPMPALTLSLTGDGALLVQAVVSFTVAVDVTFAFWPVLNGAPVGRDARRLYQKREMPMTATYRWLIPVEAGTYAVGLGWDGCEVGRLDFQARTITG